MCPTGEYLRDLFYDIIQLFEAVAVNVPRLNQKQRKAYDEIRHGTDSDSEQLFFLDASGGTDKTLFINLLLATIKRERTVPSLISPSSGIAAIWFDGGKKAQSYLQVTSQPE